MADSNELMEHMSIFADQKRIKSLLQEYMRRIVLQRPADPVSFLISEISEHPFSPVDKTVHVDVRSNAQKRAWLDTRPVHVKVELLRKLFNQYADSSENLNRGRFLVALRDNPTPLVEAFPRHARDIPWCVEKLPATREGLVTWSDFSQAAVKCLSLPGSSTD